MDTERRSRPPHQESYFARGKAPVGARCEFRPATYRERRHGDPRGERGGPGPRRNTSAKIAFWLLIGIAAGVTLALLALHIATLVLDNQ